MLDFDEAASETASVMSSAEAIEPKETLSLAERLAQKGKPNSVAGTVSILFGSHLHHRFRSMPFARFFKEAVFWGGNVLSKHSLC